MQQVNIKELADKFSAGNCTKEELAILENWYLQWSPEHYEMDGARLDALMNSVWQEMPINSGHKTFRLWSRVAAVSKTWKIAAAVAAITLGVWLYVNEIASVPRNDTEMNSAQAGMNDIAPGKNTATLTLANGETIMLSDKKTGVIIDATKLNYSDGTTISSSLRDEVKQSQLLVASTPRGGTYQFTLPDGTKVWLNADSRLEFPSQFIGKTRKVLLASGEAYFEVSKNKRMPFIVQTKDQKVTVLGTHFNMNSYGDEHGGTVTSLLEGSVELTNGVETRVLKPGERGVGTVKGFMLLKGNAADAIAWKNGDFIFEDEPLRMIMQKLARWYDIEVIYGPGVQNAGYTGVISRNKHISEVLEILERSKDIHFKIEGRRVTVIK
jgi:ferric-dicitrate binding protein FerR (iron transport regulator)